MLLVYPSFIRKDRSPQRKHPSVQYVLVTESEGWEREKQPLKGPSVVLSCVKRLCLVWCGFPNMICCRVADFNSSFSYPSLPLFKHQKRLRRSAHARKETEFLRLKRTRLGLEDFESLKVIGRGAFGEVNNQNTQLLIKYKNSTELQSF